MQRWIKRPLVLFLFLFLIKRNQSRDDISMKTDVSKFNLVPQMDEGTSESFVSPSYTIDGCLRLRPQAEIHDSG